MIPRDRRAGTPSKDSPFATRSSVPRSPIKASSSRNPELGLSLKQVIGTTCQSVTCFDCLPSQGTFAFTAGAAAVVATVDQDRKITQRFFRATPVQGTGNRSFPASPLGRQDSYGQEARLKGLAVGQNNNTYGPGSPWTNSANFDWNGDSPSGSKSGNVRERVKAATAVSFSPNGRFLAVGETGYKPRVLIFSLAEKACVDVPVTVIPEHTFGVQAVAFSPDSRYLASLGTVNDGFLYVWNIDERTGAASLMASNKCTSAIKQIAWFGSNLVTVGVRFIKVWRPNDLSISCNENGDQRFTLSGRGHKPLAGRNTILGDLLEATFTCVVPVSDDKAFVCTEGGDVCILDDSEKNQRLVRVAHVEFSIAAACLGPESRLIVTGVNGSIKALSIPELDSVFLPPAIESAPSTPTRALSRSSHYVAIGTVGDDVVTVDNRHGIQIRPLPSSNEADKLEPALQDLPAHSDAVLGVRALAEPNELEAAFLTWSSSGTVIFWSSDCNARVTLQIPLDQPVDMYNVVNELRAVVSSADASYAITGDRYGLLRILDTRATLGRTSLRAHSGEITDIAINEDSAHTLIASSSRDRTIQLFGYTSGQLDLLQTLDEHAGSVSSLLFGKSGSQLLSCSSDRTVVVREAMHRDDGSPPVYVIIKTITLKNSPTSMRMSLYDDTLLLSATDRSIQLISIRGGRATASFKASDSDNGDAVIMASLVHLPSTSGAPIIAGISSTDKSVRLYSEDGTLLARDWGHTEGVTDIALISCPSSPSDPTAPTTKLVTVAADGTIFIWATVPERPSSSSSNSDSNNKSLQIPSSSLSNAASPSNNTDPHGPPLRKVLSHSELVRFQRSKSVDLENEPLSPTTMTAASLRSPTTTLRKKESRLFVRPVPRLEPSPLAAGARREREGKGRQRSPTPPTTSAQSQQQQQQQQQSPLKHKASKVLRHRGSVIPGVLSPGAEKPNPLAGAEKTEGVSAGKFGSVGAATEQTCRALRAYRVKLEKVAASASSSTSSSGITASNGGGVGGGVQTESLKELEKELEATISLIRRTLRPSSSSSSSSSEAANQRGKKEMEIGRMKKLSLGLGKDDDAPLVSFFEEIKQPTDTAIDDTRARTPDATVATKTTTTQTAADPSTPVPSLSRKADVAVSSTADSGSGSGSGSDTTEKDVSVRETSSQEASFVSATESHASEPQISEMEMRMQGVTIGGAEREV